MKTSSLLCSSSVLLLASCCDGFTATTTQSKATTLRASSSSSNNNNVVDDVNDEGDSSRRQFMSKSVATAFTTMGGIGAFGAGSGVLAPLPANAASAADKVNARLKSYGLPSITNIPSGMKPLLEVYGKGKNRFPLLVLMNHPLTWVVQLPSNDVNGEDGTVQAGEYAKGDTATFFLYQDEGHIDNIYNVDKKLFEKVLIAAISQKGGNMYQDFKVIKSTPQIDNAAYGDRKYVLCDFKYTLLTGAGFEVERRGVASITSEGAGVEALWAASTRERFKKTETTLRDIVSSFRVYGDGLNFSAEIAKNEDRFDLEKY